MKRIVVACDGTGQSASRGHIAVSTNVNRLCHALLQDEEKSSVQQIVFYQSGIGAEDLGFKFNTIVSGAIGEGIEENIADAYTFVMNNYQPEDELFIFGFSRGAFTARVLANIICRLGVFKATEEHSAGSAILEPAKGAYAPRAFKVKIKVVGCWDTVASLGVPWRPVTHPGGVFGDYKHFDGSLVDGVEHAFHALALDECRGPFTPTLWYLPSKESSIDLRQCWFAGVHTNVGGGYPDQALADLTLAWMIDLCRPYLDFDQSYIEMCVDLDHQPRKIRSKHREGDKNGFDKTYKGWGKGRRYDSYKNGQTWTWKYRTPGAYQKSVEFTKETVHASVKERWMGGWRTKSLHGFEPREVEGGRWEWLKHERSGEVKIREEDFDSQSKDKFEWLLRYSPVTDPPADDHPH